MNKVPDQVIVSKLNPDREETWRYHGLILEISPQTILIEARFNKATHIFHGIKLQENDRFLERYYSDRWYNLFEMHDRDSDVLKGWYCNVTMPAEFSQGKIAYVDLALDLLVYPDGKYLILDEDEFIDLALSKKLQARAWQAMDELIALADSGQLAAAIQDGDVLS